MKLQETKLRTTSLHDCAFVASSLSCASMKQPICSEAIPLFSRLCDSQHQIGRLRNIAHHLTCSGPDSEGAGNALAYMGITTVESFAENFKSRRRDMGCASSLHLQPCLRETWSSPPVLGSHAWCVPHLQLQLHHCSELRNPWVVPGGISSRSITLGSFAAHHVPLIRGGWSITKPREILPILDHHTLVSG